MDPKLDAMFHRTKEVFTDVFGKTPLRSRLDDIQREALELLRFTDLNHLHEEAGDLLASLLMLFHEANWNPGDTLQDTLDKILARRHQYLTLGRKTRVAILGSACDPVTLGHIDTCSFVLDTSRTFDEAWLMPCYQHMSNKQMAPPEHRLRMCEIAAKRDGRIRIFDYEIQNKLRGETYYFAKRLLNDKISFITDFSLIIGMDNALSFANWVNAEELERLMRFVVVPREGYEPKPDIHWYLKPPHIFLAGGKSRIRNTASSTGRKALEAGNWAEAARHIDEEVITYAREHHLYGT